ncbi:MAG: sortase [Clostridia bacterium]|nr:sortase [Clostridia bacterium]
MKSKLKAILIVIAIACFAGALYYPISYRLERRSNDAELDELRELRSQALRGSAAAPTAAATENDKEYAPAKDSRPGVPEIEGTPGFRESEDVEEAVEAGNSPRIPPSPKPEAQPSAKADAAEQSGSPDLSTALPTSDGADLSATKEERPLPSVAVETVESNNAWGGTEASGREQVEFDGSAYRERVLLDEERILPQYRQLHALNEDMVGWLLQADMGIDYPVMYTPDDEEYYLHRDFYGKGNANGQLILDRDCDPYTPSWNQIIYGHNMRSGSMFGNLTNYETVEFWQRHKLIEFDSLMEERVYVVVASFRAAQYEADEPGFRYAVSFYNRAEYDAWMAEIEAARCFDTEVDCEFGDEFLTLSTCAYHRKNGRFVVVARRLRAGEQPADFEG